MSEIEVECLRTDPDSRRSLVQDPDPGFPRRHALAPDSRLWVPCGLTADGSGVPRQRNSRFGTHTDAEILISHLDRHIPALPACDQTHSLGALFHFDATSAPPTPPASPGPTASGTSAPPPPRPTHALDRRALRLRERLDPARDPAILDAFIPIVVDPGHPKGRTRNSGERKRQRATPPNPDSPGARRARLTFGCEAKLRHYSECSPSGFVSAGDRQMTAPARADGFRDHCSRGG